MGAVGLVRPLKPVIVMPGELSPVTRPDETVLLPH